MNNTISAIIIDDKQIAIRGLKKILSQFCPEVNVIAEANDVETAYELIIDKKPHLIFLDIQMPNGNGFKLLKKFDDLFFDIIFVTGHDKYALNAIKFSALDYLLKPVEVHELKDAVARALAKKEKQETINIQIQNLLAMSDKSNLEKRIVVHLNDRVVLVKLSKIEYIEGDDRYSRICAEDDQKYTVAKTLKEFEEFLIENNSFMRISKNYILNINFVKDYTKGEPCCVEMFKGQRFEISRRKKQEFLERIKGV
jgi:two-component system, LytTR family, response regulator